MQQHFRLVLASLLFALWPPIFTSCGSTGPLAQPSIEFTKAARGFVDTLGTEYVAYVLADGELSATQKQNRLDAIGDFDFAVKAAEQANGLVVFAPPDIGTPELHLASVEHFRWASHPEGGGVPAGYPPNTEVQAAQLAVITTKTNLEPIYPGSAP